MRQTDAKGVQMQDVKVKLTSPRQAFYSSLLAIVVKQCASCSDLLELCAEADERRLLVAHLVGEARALGVERAAARLGRGQLLALHKSHHCKMRLNGDCVEG